MQYQTLLKDQQIILLDQNDFDWKSFSLNRHGMVCFTKNITVITVDHLTFDPFFNSGKQDYVFSSEK